MYARGRFSISGQLRFPDHCCRHLANHHGGRIGVPTDQGRHDRNVCDPQIDEAANLEIFRTNDRHRIRPHFRRADGVIDGERVRPQISEYLVICVEFRPRQDL